jgi:hypothetical protein
MAGYILIIVAVVVVSVLAEVGRGYMVNSNDALNAARSAGYSNPVITADHRLAAGFFGCDSGDAAGFDVTATNPAGVKVNFKVCVGWPFKGATIRY